MNTTTFGAITNVGVIGATVFAVWYTGTAWALLGFLALFTAEVRNNG